MSETERGAEAVITEVGEFACQRWRDLGEAASLIEWRNFLTHINFAERLDDEVIEAIVVPNRNAVEFVIAQEPKWEALEAVITAMVDRGWDVSVLAPLASLGTAHDALHGAVASVQGWWVRDDNSFRFTQRENA